MKDMLTHCADGKLDEAYKVMLHLWKLGYSAEDIITNVFRGVSIPAPPFRTPHPMSPAPSDSDEI